MCALFALLVQPQRLTRLGCGGITGSQRRCGLQEEVEAVPTASIDVPPPRHSTAAKARRRNDRRSECTLEQAPQSPSAEVQQSE